MVDDTVIKQVEATKFLGIYLDRGLTGVTTLIVQALRYYPKCIPWGLYVVKARTMPWKWPILALCTLIYLTLHVVVWVHWSELFRLFRLQKMAVQILAKLRFRDSCRDVFKEMGLLTLSVLYICETVRFCKLSSASSQNDIVIYGIKVEFHVKRCQLQIFL